MEHGVDLVFLLLQYWDIYFFKQSLSWQAILGMFLIVVGVTLVNMYSSKTI